MENRTIETNAEMNNYNDNTTNADKTVIMISIAVTIEKILCETCIKHLMRLRI